MIEYSGGSYSEYLRKWDLNQRCLTWFGDWLLWYSVLINGQSHGFFHSTKEVKQWDRLSPALFILPTEVLWIIYLITMTIKAMNYLNWVINK